MLLRKKKFSFPGDDSDRFLENSSISQTHDPEICQYELKVSFFDKNNYFRPKKLFLKWVV